ncbi:MAG TPA: hypothetical protein PLO37_15800 [Candidatus Hydrogenedentes bacterium]|nr:hypothetical protein [Candidatus Hydrogenedentota bacterium]HPG68311.1 hypothetical protein [Candidatus Hydrogenedentota bacterium]
MTRWMFRLAAALAVVPCLWAEEGKACDPDANSGVFIRTSSIRDWLNTAIPFGFGTRG